MTNLLMMAALALATNYDVYGFATMRDRATITSAVVDVRMDVTNEVKRLAKDGTVCAVLGHRWAGGCGFDGCLVLHDEQMRNCTVCGKVESLTQIWK
jgi:hypothetical protein